MVLQLNRLARALELEQLPPMAPLQCQALMRSGHQMSMPGRKYVHVRLLLVQALLNEIADLHVGCPIS